MPPRQLPELSPDQVPVLFDALLENADRLLNSALAVLDLKNPSLARSLAILGMEESGKAIALFNRRVTMAYVPEGDAFVDDHLIEIWADHKKKLMEVHDFLVEERYWFGEEPVDPSVNAAYLGKIRTWANKHDRLKMRGFYVDIDRAGGTLSPAAVGDEDDVREIIGHVHQIGWQLRLGEHIEAKGQRDSSASVPPVSEEEIEQLQSLMKSADSDYEIDAEIVAGMRAGSPGSTLPNAAYRLKLPEPDADPFRDMGKPGYEAETRELLRLARQLEHDEFDEGEA